MKASEIFSTIRDWANGRFIKKSGDQVSGPITMTGVKSTGFQSTAGNVDVWMGIGSGGVNHGIYSKTLNKWIAYADSEKVHLLGNADTATLSDRLKNSGSLSSDDAVKSMFKNGVTMTTAYNDGYPTPYGNVLTLRGTSGGLSQLFLGWTGDNSVGKIYYRSMRDMATEWSPWKQIGDGGTINIDNETIQKNAKDQLSVPALSRVFRGVIKINSSSSATLKIPLNIDELRSGDLFFCDVNPEGIAYTCCPSTFNVLDKDEEQSAAALGSAHVISGYINQMEYYNIVPYITYNSSGNKTGFTILYYRGLDSDGKRHRFQDLLNGYTRSSSGITNDNSSLATAKSAYQAFHNDLYYHASYMGDISSSEDLYINFDSDLVAMGSKNKYLITWTAYNTTSRKIYGTGARLIVLSPDLTAAPLQVNLGISTNSGIAFTFGGYNVTGNHFTLTIKPASTSLSVSYDIYEL